MRDVPATRGAAIRAQTTGAALLVLAGITAGVLWRIVLPFALRHSDQQESFIAVDGSFALIGVGAGLITGLAVVVLPGGAPGVRSAVTVIASIGASVLAWLTGLALGCPEVQALGVLLAWPVMTSVVIFTGAVLPFTSGPIADS